MFASTSLLGITGADVFSAPSKDAQSIRPALISAIEEVLDDLQTVYDTIATTAKDHIHSEYIFFTPRKLKSDVAS